MFAASSSKKTRTRVNIGEALWADRDTRFGLILCRLNAVQYVFPYLCTFLKEDFLLYYQPGIKYLLL